MNGGVINVENLSAQEAACQEGAWFPQKNGRQKRSQGACPSQSKRQKASVLLMPLNMMALYLYDSAPCVLNGDACNARCN